MIILTVRTVRRCKKKLDVNTQVTEQKEANVPDDDKKKKKRIVAIIVILLVLLCSGLLAWNVLKNKDGKALERAVAGELGQLENKSNSEIEAELNRVIEDGTMSISINANPIFADGKSEGSLQIENSPANKYAQEIVITLDETGEEIYRSGLLLPNYHIQKDKLSKNLEKGEYNCTATFVGYDTESEKDPIRIGAAAAKIKITILS